MPSYVLHVSRETHEAFRKHCTKLGVSMKDRIESLIAEDMAPRVEVSGPMRTEVVVVVPKAEIKELERGMVARAEPLPADTSDPWTRPPFWKDRK